MSIVIQGNALSLDATTTTLAEVAHLLCERMEKQHASAAPAALDLDDPTSIDIPLAPLRRPQPTRRGAIRLPHPIHAAS